jgi:hypothetical protein
LTSDRIGHRQAKVLFDYDAKADLFLSRSGFSRRKPLEYRQFPLARDAIRYVMEELDPERLGGVCMEVEEKRFDRDGIRGLYESAAYPLARRGRGGSIRGRSRRVRTASA